MLRDIFAHFLFLDKDFILPIILRGLDGKYFQRFFRSYFYRVRRVFRDVDNVAGFDVDGFVADDHVGFSGNNVDLLRMELVNVQLDFLFDDDEKTAGVGIAV